MDDGDEFQDVFQDDVDFEEIERSAIQATQQSRGYAASTNTGHGNTANTQHVPAKTRAPNSDYGSHGEEEVIDLANENAQARSVSEKELAARDSPQDEVSLREQWRHQRYAAPSKREAAQNNGTWQRHQVPVRASQGSQSQSRAQPPKGSIASRSAVQQVRRDVPGTPQQPQGTMTANKALNGSVTLQDDTESLQARIAELEAEQTRLRKVAEDARSALYTKAGEISIVRANHEKATKEHEQKLAVLQKQHTEEVSRQKTELENARKLVEKTETDRRFLEHDLKEETKRRAAASARTAKGTISPAVTPRKQRNKMGDGFDDDEVMLMSPSRSRERRDRMTPTKSGIAAKRKRTVTSAQASPSKPLPLVESMDSFEETRSFDAGTGEVILPLRLSAHEKTNQERLELMETILSHRRDVNTERTIERLTKYNFPQTPQISISSVMYDFLMTRSLDSAEQHRSGFCSLVMDLWTRSLEERYFVPLADLCELMQAVLLDADATLANTLIPRMVTLCLKTADLVALPIAKASANSTQHKPPSAELKAQIEPLEYIELLSSIALSCCDSDEQMSSFWAAMEFDIVLVLIQKAQPLEQKQAMLRLLSTSINQGTFGPRVSSSNGSEESAEQLKRQSDLLDRLTVMLLESLEVPEERAPYTALEVLSLRAALLGLFRQMCMTLYGGRILATHRVFIGRLVRFMHESVMAMYAYDAATHDATTDLVNQSVRLLAHLMAVHADALDLRAKLAAVPGGPHMHLVALSKIAFAEGVSVLERGLAVDVAEAAHRMLDEHLSPEEGEAVVEVFSSARG